MAVGVLGDNVKIQKICNLHQIRNKYMKKFLFFFLFSGITNSFFSYFFDHFYYLTLCHRHINSHAHRHLLCSITRYVSVTLLCILLMDCLVNIHQ